MLGPAAFLRGGDALARGIAQDALFPGRSRGSGGRRGAWRSRGGSAASELTLDMIDLRLNLVAFPFQMTQSVLEYGVILIRFSSCHKLSPGQYIMEVN